MLKMIKVALDPARSRDAQSALPERCEIGMELNERSTSRGINGGGRFLIVCACISGNELASESKRKRDKKRKR